MMSELSTGLAQVMERLSNAQYRPSTSRRAEVAKMSCPLPPLPPQFTAPPSFPSSAPSALSPFAPAIPSPFVAPAIPGPVPMFTVPNFTINISPAGTLISSSSSASLPLPPTHSTLSPFSINTSSNMPLPVPPPPHLSIPFTPIGQDASIPASKWASLCSKFPASQLAAHQWKWLAGDWLPEYEHPTLKQITDIWGEWVDGIGGCIPVEILTRTWGPKWKQNIGKRKTENSRRMKVVTLIQDLAMRPGWNIAVALRFISEKYEPRYQARAFCDYLTKDTRPAVFTAADFYLKHP
ncbi:hypothetical protein C8F04DRAFT_1154470 [Mycena alexandri]|uniref:Transcription activator GCR1-like domain-containing protein n=1 Tax=Mycena alexandri TaxID=1745969 RepID=A0AAD6WM76_9AGAR|nr:hypothetical protein C8F04DRAFT_1154470 [Mycena alexandri]